jgi:hypothetical protein
MDWPIDNTIKIKNKIIINCPGFSSLYINGDNLKVIQLDYENSQENLKEFNISWKIGNDRKLTKLTTTAKPNFKYDE